MQLSPDLIRKLEKKYGRPIPDDVLAKAVDAVWRRIKKRARAGARRDTKGARGENRD